MPKIIVVFGDSNTRFWMGEAGVPGPLREAWPARLEALLNANGIPCKVRNEASPGAQARYALEGFDLYAADADFCIIALGTNDLVTGMPLDCYLEQMGGTLDKAAAKGIPAVVLGLPWFEENAAGPGVQAMLPAWNGALSALCREKGAPFVDLYGPTSSEDPKVWFNELNIPRLHLSGEGQRECAALVCQTALEVLSRQS